MTKEKKRKKTKKVYLWTNISKNLIYVTKYKS